MREKLNSSRLGSNRPDDKKTPASSWVERVSGNRTVVLVDCLEEQRCSLDYCAANRNATSRVTVRHHQATQHRNTYQRTVPHARAEYGWSTRSSLDTSAEWRGYPKAQAPKIYRTLGNQEFSPDGQRVYRGVSEKGGPNSSLFPSKRVRGYQTQNTGPSFSLFRGSLCFGGKTPRHNQSGSTNGVRRRRRTTSTWML